MDDQGWRREKMDLGIGEIRGHGLAGEIYGNPDHDFRRIPWRTILVPVAE